MLPAGHLAAAYLLWVSLGPRFEGPFDRSVWKVLLVGGLLPDLVDKPLAWGLDVLPASRALGHSLLFLVPLLLIVALFARRAGQVTAAAALAVGALSHVLLDNLPVLWNPDESAASLLWPVTTVESQAGAPAVGSVLRDTLGEPYLWAELVLVVVAVGVWYSLRRVGSIPE